MNAPGSAESLYGNDTQPPAPKGPGLLDQLSGVFTDPVALFQRLARTPVWGGALALLLVLQGVAVTIWAFRVDAEAVFRPLLERNPRIPADKIDAISALQVKIMVPASFFGLTIAFLLMAFLYWLVGKALAEDRPPSFRVAFSATTVTALVAVPKFILLAVVASLRNLGGLRFEALSPTSLGFYQQPEAPRLEALCNALDLFTLASFVLTYLAARHALRLKPAGAALCAAILAFFMIGVPVLFAK